MKYYKYKMKMGFLNGIATILMILGIIVYFLLYKEFNPDFTFLIFFVSWLFLHEIIHGLAFMFFKEVDNKNVVFGAKLESGIFYCMCKQPVSKKVIMTSLLAPLILIGIITLIIAIIFDFKSLALLSLFNISGAAGDIMMALMFLKLPGDIKYTDLDDCEGFVVLSKDNLEKFEFSGVSLIESGKYTKDIAPHDFKRIMCSKTSFVILLIVFVLFIISLF